MAVTKRNYIVGDFETITGESVGSPTLNVWNYFELDGVFKFDVADVVLKQSGVPIPSGSFELAEDTLYTNKESGDSGKTIYAMWRVTNVIYEGIETTVDGSNFGTMTDNEAIHPRLLLDGVQTIKGLKTFTGDLTTEKDFYSNSIINTAQTISPGSYTNINVNEGGYIECPTGSGDITISAFVNGMRGQTITIVKTNFSGALTIVDNSSSSNQIIRTMTGSNFAISNGYANIRLSCNGSTWFLDR